MGRIKEIVIKVDEDNSAEEIPYFVYEEAIVDEAERIIKKQKKAQDEQ